MKISLTQPLKPLSLAMLALFAVSYSHADQAAEVAQLRQEVENLRLQVEKQATGTAETPKTNTTTAALSLSPNTAFKFYGNVRLDASYQAEGSAAARMYNNINKVPLRGQAENSDRLKSTLSATRLGLDVKHNRKDQAISGKVEVDFLGGADLENLRIRHAYVQYGSWLIGQTWSNFAIPDYMPETIEALGYVGQAVKRNPQVRYQHQFQPSTSLVIAAEDPKDASSILRTPALSARLNHQLSEPLKMSLRTMINEKHTREDSLTAWGAGLGVQYRMNNMHSLKADYYHVDGDSSFVSWANPGLSTAGNLDILDSNVFDSITVGISSKWSEQWRTTVGYGYMNADVSEKYLQGTNFNKTEVNTSQWQTWANAFYQPTQPLSLGVEYVYGERKAAVAAANGERTGEDNRVNLVAIYQF